MDCLSALKFCLMFYCFRQLGELLVYKFIKLLFIINLRAHYNVVMKEIEVGGTPLNLPSDVFDSGDQKGTIVDSGTTLAYLPTIIYESLMTKVSITP